VVVVVMLVSFPVDGRRAHVAARRVRAGADALAAKHARSRARRRSVPEQVVGRLISAPAGRGPRITGEPGLRGPRLAGRPLRPL